MDEQLEFVKLIASRLDSANVPYMLTGSIAMAVYSIPRMTRDIDLIIELSPADVDTIIGLFSRDCYIDENTVKQAVNTQGIFNIIHNTWVVKADFIVRKNEVYRREEFARRRTVDIEGITISVVAAEDLILSKLVRGKQSRSELQVRDAHQIISANTKLDWGYMRKWAAALGVDDLLVRIAKDE